MVRKGVGEFIVDSGDLTSNHLVVRVTRLTDNISVISSSNEMLEFKVSV